eukprot:37934-Rhodomonas_salina.5
MISATASGLDHRRGAGWGVAGRLPSPGEGGRDPPLRQRPSGCADAGWRGVRAASRSSKIEPHALRQNHDGGSRNQRVYNPRRGAVAS